MGLGLSEAVDGIGAALTRETGSPGRLAGHRPDGCGNFRTVYLLPPCSLTLEPRNGLAWLRDLPSARAAVARLYGQGDAEGGDWVEIGPG